MSATLVPPGKADGASGRFQSDEAMHVAITRAWDHMLSRHERRTRPLRSYVFAPCFVGSASASPIDKCAIACVCAQVACRRPWELGRLEPMPLAHPPREAYDPVVAWWHAMDAFAEVGVHYAELGSGILEFVSVDRRNIRHLGQEFP